MFACENVIFTILSIFFAFALVFIVCFMFIPLSEIVSYFT